MLFFGNKEDPVSGGQVGANTNQLDYGIHIENIFFPSNAPEGTYTFYVVPFNMRNESDEWTITTILDGKAIESVQGSGISDAFEYVFLR